ncbi:MAG: Ca-activated chloride channel family protein [Polyangiales bacterium]|jgi:Ca-activated chloride channel family protein
MTKRRIKRALSRTRGRTHLIAAGALTLALGSVVLLRAPTHAESAYAEPSPPQVSSGSDGLAPITFESAGLSGSIELSQRALPTGQDGTLFAEVNLVAGAAIPGRTSPVAVSLVLDTSGSMRGEKIEQARMAVREIIAQLGDEDLFSLVTYDSEARVRLPLTAVRTLRHTVDSHVRAINAGGGTIIPPALELGAQSLQFAPGAYVRRVVLISDGQDGSGQTELQVRDALGRHAQQGVAFSAMGLGVDYNEGFLTNVADAGAGNYAFVAGASDLPPFLSRELESVRNTAFDNVVAELTLPPGWRVQRGFGVTHSVDEGVVTIPVGQLGAGQTRKVIVQLHGPTGAVGAEQSFAARLRFRSLANAEVHSMPVETMSVLTVASEGEAFAARVQGVYTRANAVAIDEAQREAVEAWRGGDLARADELTEGNRVRLQALRANAPSDLAPELERQEAAYELDQLNFRSHSAGSAQGRAHGLSSNSRRRGRSQ